MFFDSACPFVFTQKLLNIFHLDFQGSSEMIQRKTDYMFFLFCDLKLIQDIFKEWHLLAAILKIIYGKFSNYTRAVAESLEVICENELLWRTAEVSSFGKT